MQLSAWSGVGFVTAIYKSYYPFRCVSLFCLVGGFDLKLCEKYYLSGLVGLLVIEMFASWGALRLFIMQQKY